MNDNDTRNDTPASSGSTENALDAAKQKLASLAEKAKEHDFKEDARKAAEGVKNLADNLKQRDFKEDARKAAEGAKALKESLGKHDFKAELREAFAETKKNPASIWKKPETLRPGKDLAVVGLAASVVLLLLLLVTSSSSFGLVCLVLGLGALLFSALGLKTEGRKLAVGGSVVGLLVLLCALGQTFGSSGGGAEDEDGMVDSLNGSPAMSTEGAKVTYDLSPLPENEGEESESVEDIFENAENARRIKSLNFFGFYTGMSYADAMKLKEHYGIEGNEAVFQYNYKTGEVHSMYFSPKALYRIAEIPDDYEAALAEMMSLVGSANWGEDAFDGSHFYRTADKVTLVMNGLSWMAGVNKACYIKDSSRANAANTVNAVIDNNNNVRETARDLVKKGVNIRIFKLPGDVELLIKEVPDMELWISHAAPTQAQCDAFGCKSSKTSPNPNLIAALNNYAAVKDAGFVFRSPENGEFSFDKECHKDWQEYHKDFPDETWESFAIERMSMCQGVMTKGLPEAIEKGLVGKEGKENTYLVAVPEAWIAAKKAEEEQKIAEMNKEGIEANNRKCAEAQAALKKGKIETKVVELPNGVQLLMTKIGQQVDGIDIDWVATFELTSAQWTAVEGFRDEIPVGSDNSIFQRKGAEVYPSFVEKLNETVKGSGWEFRIPSGPEWDFAAGITGFETQYINRDDVGIVWTNLYARCKIGTLADRIKGTKFGDLEEKLLEPRNHLRDGEENPNYYGLYNMRGPIVEMNQPLGIRDAKLERSEEGGLRLFGTFSPKKGK